jgi:transposase InsO family protein
MPYTSNKHMPKIRRDAAALVRSGWSTRKVARHFGFTQSAVVKWVAKAKKLGVHPIPTLSSRPKSHPRQLGAELVWKIFQRRLLIKRSAEVVYQELRNEGVEVSLASVKRTLDRTGLLKKRSPYKRFHPHQDRPHPLKPGDLVQLDTIHLMVDEKKRIYVYVLIDVYSRWVYVKAYAKIGGRLSLRFIKEAQRCAPFQFNILQSDHGSEFGPWFVEQVKRNHRYTRIGKPNDNAHIERFNRTVQEECLDKVERSVRSLNKALKTYVPYYNEKRLHFGLNLKTPNQFIPKVMPSY